VLVLAVQESETVCCTAIAVPVRATVWALELALSEIDSDPVSIPLAVGAKKTSTLQLAPEASDEPQLLPCEKLALATILLKVTAVEPVLVSVTVCAALVVPTVWLAKVKLVVERLTETDGGGELGVLPEPVSATVWALELALSEIDREPVSVPVVVGEKATEIVQPAPAASDEPQLLLCEKLELAVMALKVTAVEPVLVSVTVCAALEVPTVWLAKVKLVVERLTDGSLGAELWLDACPQPMHVSAINKATANTSFIRTSRPVLARYREGTIEESFLESVGHLSGHQHLT
jgi:hypothetical protein